MGARTIVRQGCAGMSQLPAPNSQELRARYPGVFNRPVSARLATPVMMLGALGIFVFG